MLRPQGYATIFDPDARGSGVVEHDTITCGHCQAIVFVKPGTVGTVYLLHGLDGAVREEPGAGCFVCRRPVCLACHDIGTCSPWEKQMELMEAVDRAARRG